MLKGWMGKTVICVAMLAGTLAAQIGGTGTIKGSVADPSGALIPGATVSATHIATGIETKRESTAAGLFVIAPLPAGVYKLSVSAQGFRTTVQDQVVVDALTTVELSLKLEVGATAESVTVTAAQAELNTPTREWARPCATICTPRCRFRWAAAIRGTRPPLYI
jgi:hypothetical protein